MSGRLAWGLLACLIGPLCVGCTSSSGTIRGQNPGPQAVGVVHGDDGIVQHFKNAKPHHMKVTTYAGPGGQPEYHHHGPQNGRCGYCQGAGVINGAGCPACAQNGMACNGGPGWYPTHKHRFSYNPPRDLVYPQQNTPAAVVQFPYYTVKGPDDFFLK